MFTIVIHDPGEPSKRAYSASDLYGSQEAAYEAGASVVYECVAGGIPDDEFTATTGFDTKEALMVQCRLWFDQGYDNVNESSYQIVEMWGGVPITWVVMREDSGQAETICEGIFLSQTAAEEAGIKLAEKIAERSGRTVHVVNDELIRVSMINDPGGEWDEHGHDIWVQRVDPPSQD